eukprot:CAMPEP_0119497272 /NCGR_PEP_ID=MMETSP1344-20130328/20362_1 /TAXON_ID=236787 /ORGANISM="Florenciella parvula, Strain CCMP2471" /LENGTH=39 /DNA_ID= /DNA_START= /DNA_END= /DNA_ORIENTATION=
MVETRVHLVAAMDRRVEVAARDDRSAVGARQIWHTRQLV